MKLKKSFKAAKRAAEKATEYSAIKPPEPETSSLDDIQMGAVAKAPEDLLPEEYDSDVANAGLTAGEGVIQAKRKKKK